MKKWEIEQIIELCKIALDNIESWDGNTFTKEEYEERIAGLEFDLTLILDYATEMKNGIR